MEHIASSEPTVSVENVCPEIAPAIVKESLSMSTFLDRLRERLDAHADARDAEYDAFVTKHGLAKSESLRLDHARMRLLFEATRDGGFWGLRWSITNQDASSKLIWSSWRDRPGATVTAECDELSALFAGVAHGVGVRSVGLFWPTWNHTIAAWEPTPKTRILVPTSQIFLACDATFDQTTFDEKHQKIVFEFPVNDLGKESLSAELATFLLSRIDVYGDASSEVLAAIRIKRAIEIGSSVPERCGALADELLASRDLSCGDRRALTARQIPFRR